MFAQIRQESYRLYSVKDGKEVSLDEISEDMHNFDVLFFGEEHDDPVAHHLQNRVFEMANREFNNKVTLSLEMLDRDVQLVMNEYLDGSIRERNFTKDARVWNNYEDYRPLVEFSKQNKIDVICANSPARYTNLAGRKGQMALTKLSNQAKTYFAPLPYEIASGKYYEKLIRLTSHRPSSLTDTAGTKVPQAMPMGDFNVIVAQSLWDATMADSIYEYLKKNKGKKIMQVNGRYHSDEGFAVVSQLKRYNPKIKALIISAGPDASFPNIQWEKHKHLGDYIIIPDPRLSKAVK